MFVSEKKMHGIRGAESQSETSLVSWRWAKSRSRSPSSYFDSDSGSFIMTRLGRAKNNFSLELREYCHFLTFPANIVNYERLWKISTWSFFGSVFLINFFQLYFLSLGRARVKCHQTRIGVGVGVGVRVDQEPWDGVGVGTAPLRFSTPAWDSGIPNDHIPNNCTSQRTCGKTFVNVKIRTE